MPVNRLSAIAQFFTRLLVLLLLPLTWFSPYFLVRMVGLSLTLLGGIAWLYWRQRCNKPFAVPLFALPMTLFVLWQLISVAFAPLPIYSLKFVLLNVLLLLLFFFFVDSLGLGWTPEQWLTALFSTGSLIIAIELIPGAAWLARWQHTTGTLFPLPPIPFTLPGVLLTNPNVTAGFVNLFIPLILVKLFLTTGTKRIGWGILLVVFLLTEYFSGSRTGWISLVASVTVTLGVLGWQRLRKLSRTQIIAGLTVGVGIGGIAAQQIFWRGKQSFTAARADIWHGAWQLFIASPLTGNGIASFTPLYAQTNAIPPGFVPSHAHNLLLEIMAETGFVGIILLGWGLWVGWKMFRIYGDLTNNHSFTPAWLGSGTAITIHHFGDYLLWQPLYTAFALLLLAVATHQLPQTVPLRRGNWLLAATLGVLITTGGWTLRGNMQYERGLVAARANDWASARENICSVAAKYPEKTLFEFQCGLASVRWADETGDTVPISDALPLALDALNRDPYWSVHRANVAMMLWQAGQRADGFALMQAVAESTPQNSLLALNAGWMAEKLGDNDAARKWYSTAIDINPALANDVYFLMTPLRQSMPGAGNYRAPLANGWEALAAGDYASAAQIFNIELADNSRNAEAWAGLAMAQLGLNNPAAEHSLATAKFISPNHFRVVGTEATFAHFQGDDARAAAILQNYLKDLTESTLHTNYYSAPYYFGAYNQVGLPFDLLPQFRRPLMDISMQPFIEWLKNYHTAGGTP